MDSIGSADTSANPMNRKISVEGYGIESSAFVAIMKTMTRIHRGYKCMALYNQCQVMLATLSQLDADSYRKS